MSQIGNHPQFSGWKFQKYLSCHQANSNRRWFGLQTKRVTESYCLSQRWRKLDIFRGPGQDLPLSAFQGREASQQTTQMEPNGRFPNEWNKQDHWSTMERFCQNAILEYSTIISSWVAAEPFWNWNFVEIYVEFTRMHHSDPAEIPTPSNDVVNIL